MGTLAELVFDWLIGFSSKRLTSLVWLEELSMVWSDLFDFCSVGGRAGASQAEVSGQRGKHTGRQGHGGDSRRCGPHDRSRSLRPRRRPGSY